ncbi:MAG: Na+/H+ antiporter NhaC [Gammaproteobacteria bacterium]|nr:MAG: Na+/H+ antiporter NhaC [Gammaproteobacteria bacterium]
MTEQYKEPSLLDSLTPITFLIGLLFTSVYFFGADSSYGGNQIALLFCSGIATIIGVKNGIPWHVIEKGIVKGISMAMGAILILLVVGGLIGTWIQAGIVPTMIYYGLMLLSPDWFYVASCLICAVIAISIGSSWTVAGTIGIGLIGIASGLGLSIEITAGAIISGAYFGDKMSPLSDTTNLAPAVTGTDLFSHIRHMMWTTVPSLCIALIIFTIIGLNSEVSGDADAMGKTLILLQEQFYIHWILLAPLVFVLFMAMKKVPALVTIFLGALVGGLVGAIFQSENIIATVNKPQLANSAALLQGVWEAIAIGYKSTTGNVNIDDLLTRGGMASMLNTIWLIITAMTFGSVLETTGIIQRLVRSILSLVKSTGSMIAATVATCIGTNIVAGDQYIAIVIPGRMYKLEFEKRGLDPKNLSRVLEDSATITSPLIPWNTCGAFMAGTLGVATFAYLPFCFFNLVNPVISVIYGYTGFKLVPLEKDENNSSKREDTTNIA